MPVFTIVQHIAQATDTAIAPGTHQISVSATLPSPVTVGNTLIAICACHASSANNTGINVPATSGAGVTDSLFSSWTQAAWIEAGVQICGVGSFYLPNAAAGSYTVTFKLNVPNANPIFTLDQVASIVLVEVSNFSASPHLQGVTTQQNGAGAGSMVLAITDSQSVVISSDFGSPNQISGIVTDLSDTPGDFFIAGLTGDIVILPVPGVSPPSFAYTLLDTASNSGLDYLNVWTGDIAGPPSPPQISCGSPPNGIEGIPYTHTFPVSGGTPPYTFSITSGSLPPGITLDTSTGTVSGTPTTPGTFPFRIQVTDNAAQSAHVDCTITIISSLSLSCGNPPDGEVGVSYTHTFPALGGLPPYTFAITLGILPPGLALDTATGIVSGIPTTPGVFIFTIQVMDALSVIRAVQCSITILQFSSLRLVYYDSFLMFDYPDTGPVALSPNTFEIDTQGGFWPHQYVNPVITHYWEETQEGITPHGLMGTADGYLLRAGGTTDASQIFTPVIRTPSFDFTDPRTLKLFMDTMTDVDPTGGYDITFGFDNYSVLTGTTTIPPAPGRVQILNSISSPAVAGLKLYRNFAAEYAFLPGTVLYEFEPSFYTQPFYSSFYTTQLMDHGIPGWKQLRFGRIAVISVSAVRIQILNDDGVTLSDFTIPSTSGVLKNYFVQLPNAAKGRLLRYTASSVTTAEFVLFIDKTFVRIKKWGGASFLEVMPFIQ